MFHIREIGGNEGGPCQFGRHPPSQARSPAARNRLGSSPEFAPQRSPHPERSNELALLGRLNLPAKLLENHQTPIENTSL